MMDYFLLIKQYPSLFQNTDALIKIVTHKETIENWEKNQKSKLKDDSKPSEWADIGVVFDDPYFVIFRDLVEFPDGQMRGYSRSFGKAYFYNGLGVVILAEYQGKFLLLHQYRHPTRQWHYEVPRGYGEPNTPADKNAHVEIQEEIGGEIAELFDLGGFYNNTGFEGHSVRLFYAKLASVGTPEINEGIESFIWLTVKELEEWIADDKITDGFTIAVYTKAKLKGLI